MTPVVPMLRPLQLLKVIETVIAGELQGVKLMNTEPMPALLTLVELAPLVIPMLGTRVLALALDRMMVSTVRPIRLVAVESMVRLSEWDRAAPIMALLGVSIRVIKHGLTIMLSPVTVVVTMVPRTMAARGLGARLTLIGRLVLV